MTGALPTREQLDILLHSLGLVAPYYGEPYRSYFCTYGSYSKWLEISDVQPDLTFGDFLRGVQP